MRYAVGVGESSVLKVITTYNAFKSWSLKMRGKCRRKRKTTTQTEMVQLIENKQAFFMSVIKKKMIFYFMPINYAQYNTFLAHNRNW